MTEPSHRCPRVWLRSNDLVCLALLVGQIVYAVAIAMVQRSAGWEPPLADPEMSTQLATVGIGLGIVSIPAGYLMRKIIWQKGGGGTDARLLQTFFTGNITFQVVLESASLVNLTLWLITGRMLPFVPVFAVLLVTGIVALLRSRTPPG